MRNVIITEAEPVEAELATKMKKISVISGQKYLKLLCSLRKK